MPLLQEAELKNEETRQAQDREKLAQLLATAFNGAVQRIDAHALEQLQPRAPIGTCEHEAAAVDVRRVHACNCARLQLVRVCRNY